MMANNRLYLKCPGCGKRLCIGKTFGASFYVPPYGERRMEDVVDKFYEDHWLCTFSDSEEWPFGGVFALEDEEDTYK